MSDIAFFIILLMIFSLIEIFIPIFGYYLGFDLIPKLLESNRKNFSDIYEIEKLPLYTKKDNNSLFYGTLIVLVFNCTALIVFCWLISPLVLFKFYIIGFIALFLLGSLIYYFSYKKIQKDLIPFKNYNKVELNKIFENYLIEHIPVNENYQNLSIYEKEKLSSINRVFNFTNKRLKKKIQKLNLKKANNKNYYYDLFNIFLWYLKMNSNFINVMIEKKMTFKSNEQPINLEEFKNILVGNFLILNKEFD